MPLILSLFIISSLLLFQNCGFKAVDGATDVATQATPTTLPTGTTMPGNNTPAVDYSGITNPIPVGSVVQTLATGHGFVEGPIWVPSLNSLIYTDQSNNTLYIWDAATSMRSIFRTTPNKPNGNLISADGFLLTCEAAPLRRIAKTDLITKATTSLVENYNGQPLNAPNDMTMYKDGSVYFTDPTYNTPAADIRQPVRGVYRVLPNGAITLIYSSMTQPNGLVFSPDYKYLYVNDSQTQTIKRLEIDANGNMIAESNFASINAVNGGYDGMAMDAAGNLYTGGNRAVNIYNPLGQLIQSFPIGENTTNMKFGGPDKKTLFVLATTTVRKVLVLIPGM